MRIDLNCPVEAWKATLPQSDHPSSDVTLFNLSSMQVVSVEVTLLLTSEDGEDSARIIHRSRGLDGAPGRVFHMEVPVEGHFDAARYEITVDKVWFDNASVWRREKDGMIEYEPNNLHRSPQLTVLRKAAGELASGYPQQQKGLWVCVCGRPNLDETTTCARCHREKDDVFARFSKEKIEGAMAEREKELAEKSREALLRNSREDEKTQRVQRKPRYGRALKAGGLLVLALALVWGAVNHGVPFVHYELAKRDQQNQQYQDAETAFAALGDYRDAPQLALRARYDRACALMAEDANTADLAEAREIMASLGDYEDAAERIRQCDWRTAEILFAEEKYDEAEKIYAALGDYEEAPARLTEISYIRACAMLENGQWEEARKAFTALGDYRDSAEKRLDTWYEPALEAIGLKNADYALTLLAAIPGHRNADTLVKQLHYEEGVALRAQGKTNEAAEAFDKAAGYLDAADQANECFYGPASVAYEIMDYERAAELFARILPYRDSREKWRAATIEAAKTAMKQIDYEKAKTLLAALPEDDADAASLKADCIYEPAMNDYLRGDYEQAIAGFSQISAHRDSADMVQKCKYAQANQLMASAKYEQAAALYAELGEYEDAADLLIDARYAQAEAMMISGDAQQIASALTIYESLGDYRDAAQQLQSGKMAQADALLASGNAQAAKAIYASLEQTETTALKLLDCDYALAVQLADEGKLDEALAAFTALNGHGDSAEKANELRYRGALRQAETDPEGAIEALTALGGYADSAYQADAIRYRQAEALIETDSAAAIAAFEAIAGHEDAITRANELRYSQAEDLIATDRAAAIAAFEAIGGHGNAIDRANELRYEDARALEASGDWQAAAAVYDKIAGYEDATSRADALRYDAGLAYAEAGDWENAAAAFGGMSGEMDSSAEVNRLRYEAAETLFKNGSADAAAAAFEAISSYRDAGERANAIRYEQAITLAETDPDAALAAFEALGDYADSEGRIKDIYYDRAEALIDTDWAAAAAAFNALGDHEDSQDRAKALYYNEAARLALAGDWRQASEIYASLGDYSDAAKRAKQVPYDAAAKLVSAEKWDEAVAIYTELGDYADSAARIKQTRYAQGESLQRSGEYLTAADVFRALGAYEDASIRADAAVEAYYSGPATAMAAAHENGDHAQVIQVMSWLDTSQLPKKYNYLYDLYYDACYKEGNRLYNAQKPYEALVYYKELPDGYGDMKTRMQQPCYLILGTWEDLQGNRYIFREEGVCNMNGEVLFFIVDGTTLFTGETADMLAITHRLTGVNRTHAWLYDQRGEKEITIYLTRIKD